MTTMTTTATPAAETEPEGPHPVWRVLTERARADSRPEHAPTGTASHSVGLACGSTLEAT
ncbi:hypothetical protein ABZT28_29665 [Streptomyces sp. NPDC005388]|uniref:hypothetical protein n=1 Tax=Streptomyces sp. NPDC005388 TaxID=3156717 RepID=UPI0033BDBD52